MSFPIRPGQIMGKPFAESVPDHVEALFPGIRARLPRRDGVCRVLDLPPADDVESPEAKLADLKSFLAARADTLTVEEARRQQRQALRDIDKKVTAGQVEVWNQSPERQMLSAVHESSHGLMALLLWDGRCSVHNLSIGLDGDDVGRCQITFPVGPSRRDVLTVAAAGSAGEALYAGRRFIGEYGDGGDLSHAAKLLGVSVSRTSPEWEAAYDRATAVLEKPDNWRAVTAVADLLFRRGELSGRDFVQTIRQFAIG